MAQKRYLLIIWRHLFLFILARHLHKPVIIESLTSIFRGFTTTSRGLIILRVWIRFIMFYISQGSRMLNNKLFMLIIINRSFLYRIFMADNIFLFYVLFEICLMPIFFIIIGWGYQPERLSARYFIVLYTIIRTMLLLIFLLNYSSQLSIFRFELLAELNLRTKIINNSQIIFLLILTLGLFTKFPIYLFHVWLPRAHLEAPVIGSVLLAAVLLKLAGFGLWKFRSIILQDFGQFFIIFRILGGSLIGIVCILEKDIKKLIAYSSVAHMAFIIRNYLNKRSLSAKGGLLFIYRHGTCSSMLFIGRFVIYLKRHSRRMYFNYRYLRVIPIFRRLWCFSCLCRIGIPPTRNFFREIFCIIGVIGLSNYYILPVCLLSYMAAVYSLILYSNTQRGQLEKFRINDELRINYYIIFIYFLFWRFILFYIL